MGNRNTVYEDRAEKEARRAEKRRAHIEKHVVLCPHCSKNVLDHMTECPHCKGKLTPVGYQPMDEKKRKKIQIVTYTIGFIVAAVVIVLVFVLK